MNAKYFLDKGAFRANCAVRKVAMEGRDYVKSKLEDLKTGANDYIEAAGAEISARADRLRCLVGALDGVVIEAVPAAHVLAGAGDGGVMDSGIVLDWTSGAPVLPGSSIKGAVRAWATHWATLQDLTVEDVCDDEDGIAWAYGGIFGFGPVDRDPGFAGGIVFFEGIFTGVRLAMDVLTPHHRGFRRGPDGEVAAPADWDSPEPHQFLVVDRAQGRLVTGLALRRSPLADPDLLTAAHVWTERALAHTGVGARTTEGWGRFAFPAPTPG